MELIIYRHFLENSTPGILYLVEGNGDEVKLCYTLEDPRRFPGVKVYGATCIPAGRFMVSTSISTRFKRQMPMIYNCANGYELKAEGISFKGIRMHGLNKAEETLGCIGVGHKQTKDKTRIYQTAEKLVTAVIRDAEGNGEEIWLEIVDEVEKA